MEKYQVLFTEQADMDLYRIAEYIAQDNPQRAISYIAELQIKTQDALSVFPKKTQEV